MIEIYSISSTNRNLFSGVLWHGKNLSNDVKDFLNGLESLSNNEKAHGQ